jgi:hypothetical protein
MRSLVESIEKEERGCQVKLIALFQGLFDCSTPIQIGFMILGGFGTVFYLKFIAPPGGVL